MKRQLALLTAVFVSMAVHAQKTEFRVNLQSGLFTYHGGGSARASTMNFYSYDTPELNSGPAVQTPYGRRTGFPLVLEAQVLRSGKKGFLYGAGLGAEMLTSRVRIDSMFVWGGDAIPADPSLYYSAATGHARLTNLYVNLNPFVGKRWLLHGVTLDVLGGTDIAFCLSSHEKGSGTGVANGTHLVSDVKHAYPAIDFRPRIQIQVSHQRVTYLAGYSLGLTNYQAIANSKAYSGFLRLGIGYRIK